MKIFENFSTFSKGNLKISTCIVLAVSILIAITTLCISLYALFFVNKIFGYLVQTDQLYAVLKYFNTSLQKLLIAFFLFGVTTAYFIPKIILTPLNSLLEGSKQLTQGNLDYRLKRSKYFEIDALVQTYNKMASALQSLYKNLEQKVKDRTMELEKANEELKSTEVMMVHSEKMRSLGQLVAGITHEINNPINFIYGNLVYLNDYSKGLIDLINCYEKYDTNLSEEAQKEIKEIKEKIELDYIKEDLPSLIKSCREGTERTKNIVMDLKNFSRLDEMVISEINIPKEIDTTLNILHNKIKNRIEIIKEYEQNIPLVDGYGGQINQVFMNILDNACYAISDEGKIYIRIKNKENHVIIEFEDTGSGIEKDKLTKIFEPFFTTKPVGEGTGLGMSISYEVIKLHNGKIEVESEVGKGTKFTIELPVKMEKTPDNENVE